MKKHLMPHNPIWKTNYQTEATAIQQTLGENIVCIHHIGSTSIPNIVAKPIIDILVEVKELEAVDARTCHMTDLAYEAKGTYGIEGRRYFRKHNENGTRTHHVHVFECANLHAVRHIAFRDYLIAHPETAKDYSNLKTQLATNGHTYQEAKEPFITPILKKALEWKAALKHRNRETQPTPIP